MKDMLKKIGRLFIGLILYSLGIALTVNANVGLAPWDVFHQGIARNLGITMGQASIGVGVIIVAADFFLGERVGWGTLSNMYFIGIFLDILLDSKLIPVCHGLLSGIMMLLLGMFVIGVATYCYISAGFGSGPRDGLMVALTKKTGKSVRLIRSTIESSALVAGYLLGGYVGIGTVISALGLGYFTQFAFKLFKFDVKSVQHRFIDQDIAYIRGLLQKEKKEQENEIAIEE